MTDKAKPVKVIAGAAKFRATLATLETDALRDIADLGGNIDSIVSARQDSNSDDEHDPEGTTLAFERSQSDALLRQTEQRLKDILAARARLETGTFGTCATCGAPIAHGRLVARPYASTCINCAS
jgi:RNA polymerase-binding transcription factor DksA